MSIAKESLSHFAINTSLIFASDVKQLPCGTVGNMAAVKLHTNTPPFRQKNHFGKCRERIVTSPNVAWALRFQEGRFGVVSEARQELWLVDTACTISWLVLRCIFGAKNANPTRQYTVIDNKQVEQSQPPYQSQLLDAEHRDFVIRIIIAFDRPLEWWSYCWLASKAVRQISRRHNVTIRGKLCPMAEPTVRRAWPIIDP
jgi:hypothetical protein